MTDKVNPFNSPDPTLRYDGEGLSPYKGEDPTQKYEQELNPFTQPDPTERYKEPVTPHDEMKELINQVALSKLESNISSQITEQNNESGKITETSTQIQSNAISPGVVPAISSSPLVASGGPVSVRPFELVSEPPNIRVRASVVNAAPIPDYIFPATGSGSVWVSFTRVDDEATSIAINRGTPPSPSDPNYIVLIGSWSAAEVSNVRYGPVYVTFCRDWFVSPPEYTPMIR